MFEIIKCEMNKMEVEVYLEGELACQSEIVTR